MRLAGHALVGEGAPHTAAGEVTRGWGTGGPGRAKCECGIVSPMFRSSRERRRWHARHKQQIAADA